MPGASQALPDKNADSRRRRIKNTKNDPQNAAGEKIVTGAMDLPFFFIIMVLLVMGIIMMFSAGYAWAIAEGEEGTYYVKRQFGMALVGLVGMFIVSFIDYHIYRKPIIVFGLYGFSVLLLILCRVGPFTDPHNNSWRWIKIADGIPSFQPSEIMKLAIIILFAYLISINYSRLKYFKYGIVPFAAFLAVVVGLMALQPHFSGTIIICAIGIVMMFVGGSNVKHLVILGIVGVLAIIGIILLLIQVRGLTYIETRMVAWLDPFNEDAADQTWQTRNSLIAIGSGGLFGLGLGNSRQKFLYLPESKNDFVFAIVCEELGFVGALMVIVLFLLFIIRGFFIASKAPDKFGMMLAVGLTVQIGMQALLNIAVVTSTIPCTGVSLPFFSYGGTARIMQLVQMGIVLNISRKSIIKN